MVALSFIALFATLRFFVLLVVPTSPVGAVPLDQAVSAPSSYWQSDIKRQGKAAFGDSAFQVFRNVKDFGAKGKLPYFPSNQVTDALQVMEIPTIPKPSTMLSLQGTDAVKAAIHLPSPRLWSTFPPARILSASLWSSYTTLSLLEMPLVSLPSKPQPLFRASRLLIRTLTRVMDPIGTPTRITSSAKFATSSST